MRYIEAVAVELATERVHPARLLVLLVLQWGLVIGFMQCARASPTEACSSEMSRRAQSLLAGARGQWSSLVDHQRVFAACDDGALGEGYSDAVVRLLAHEWPQFSTFAALGRTHPVFQRWAIRHIDATASDEDLSRIIANASNCSDDVLERDLCKTIRHAASEALSESVQMKRR